jgi:alpha-galactosidase
MTDSPNWVNNLTTSVEYRFLSSMQGSLGVGANLDKWTPDDFAVAKDMIAAYKQVRETVKQRIFRDGVCLARIEMPRTASCPA